MRTEPGPTPQTPRHHQLKGSLALGAHRGRSLPCWQIEVTGGGRIWYLIDVKDRTVWVTYAGTGHPRATNTAAPPMPSHADLVSLSAR